MRAGYKYSENRQLKLVLSVTRKALSELLQQKQALRTRFHSRAPAKKINYLLKAERWFHSSPIFDRAAALFHLPEKKYEISNLFIEAI